MTKRRRERDSMVRTLAAILSVIALILGCAAVCCAADVPLYGDANGDGVIDMKDVLTVRKYVAELSVTLNLATADANRDGAINTKDVLWLRKYIAAARPTTTPTASPTAVPNATSEMRGVWFAYYEVAALLKSTPAASKAAIDAAFDTCKADGINAVFFHVRAYSDAYYSSKLFPQVAAVKSLLKQGFDPLAYAVQAAHSRQMTLHAWLNPYRVGDGKNTVCADTFVFDGKTYYNPASEAVKQLLLNGIGEILDNYDVDGIHLDDYFYPSGVPATAQSFDTGYTAKSGSLAVWRRAQVTDFVKRACALTHKKKPNATFGISPSGNIETDRDTLYADVEAWLKTPGCVDYLCPQLYYGFQNSAAPFSATLRRWAALPRADGVKLYAGLAVYKAGLLSDTWAGAGKTEWSAGGDLLARQVKDARAADGVDGVALFSYRYLTGEAFDDSCDSAVVQNELKNLKRELLA